MLLTLWYVIVVINFHLSLCVRVIVKEVCVRIVCISIVNVVWWDLCQYWKCCQLSALSILSDEICISIGNVVRWVVCQYWQCCQRRSVSASAMLSDVMCVSIGNVASLPVVWTSFGQCMAGMVWQHCISWVPACTAVVTRVLLVNNWCQISGDQKYDWGVLVVQCSWKESFISRCVLISYFIFRSGQGKLLQICLKNCESLNFNTTFESNLVKEWTTERMASTPTKQYKTLPGPLRREERRRHQHGEISHR